jgi:hypothetical protein
MNSYDWREVGQTVGVDHPAFAQIAAELKAHELRARQELETDLFRTYEGDARLRPPTWRDRLIRKARDVRRYFVTLWAALRGRDPYESDDYY